MIPNHYYNAVIKRYYTIFGALFSNLNIKRYDKSKTELQEIKVHIFHSNKQRFLARYDEQNKKNPQMNRILPRMGFSLIDFNYDPSRQTTQTLKYCGTNSATGGVTEIYNPVPYNFLFELNIAVEYMDDALQILEQILPYFQPNLSVPIIEIPELDLKRDINITLDSVDPEFEIYDQMFNNKRKLAYTLRFKLEGYLYPSMSQAGIIKKILLNFDGDSILDPDDFQIEP